jgi:hypothetical protein
MKSISLDTPRADFLRAGLEGAGITGAAQDAILRETAPQRAEIRTKTALAALLDAALAAHDRECVSGEGDACVCFRHEDRACFGDRRAPANVRRVGAALGYADVAGIGGHMGVSGDATARIPVLRGLGKSRKHASDGGAWSAAIATAAYRLVSGSDKFAALRDGRLVFGEVGTDPDLAHASGLAVDVRHAVPYGWLLTIAREGLRRAVGLQAWHESVPIYAPAASALAWAESVNRLDAASRHMCHVCAERQVPSPAEFERPDVALVTDVPTCKMHAAPDQICCDRDRAGQPCQCDAQGAASWGPRTYLPMSAEAS